MEKKPHPLVAYRESQQPPLSRAKLAEKIGVRRPTIFRWETGDRKIDESKLPDVIRVTGIPAKELRPDLIQKHEEIFGVSQ
jgi:DNA-binding transcriptional regulator YdaS (Cro superfamily)